MLVIAVGIFMFLFGLFYGLSLIVPVIGGIMVYLALRKLLK
jgi:hypothetical protein